MLRVRFAPPLHLVARTHALPLVPGRRRSRGRLASGRRWRLYPSASRVRSLWTPVHDLRADRGGRAGRHEARRYLRALRPREARGRDPQGVRRAAHLALADRADGRPDRDAAAPEGTGRDVPAGRRRGPRHAPEGRRGRLPAVRQRVQGLPGHRGLPTRARDAAREEGAGPEADPLRRSPGLVGRFGWSDRKRYEILDVVVVKDSAHYPLTPATTR